VPVPVTRNPEQVRSALQRWFDGRGVENLLVNPGFEMPKGAGNANETLLFSVTSPASAMAAERSEELVLRLEATKYALFMEIPLVGQCDVLAALKKHTSLRVPEVRWMESDSSILGAPFCIMTRVSGRVPPDYPGAGTWIRELLRDDQRQLWENAFSTFCSIHKNPVGPDVQAALERFLRGTGIEQQLDYWGRYRDWATVHDPRLDRLYDWVVANVPADVPVGLSWGDARMQNMIFDDDLKCTAILDWEMVSLGGPLLDLAWWLVFDRFFPTFGGDARPSGYGTRDETIRAWLEHTGIATTNLGWYEVFCAYRLGLIVSRIERLGAELGADTTAGYDLVASTVALGEETLASLSRQ
jgi:aminoglycoside phosphotransferase (APT) family kinase protein